MYNVKEGKSLKSKFFPTICDFRDFLRLLDFFKTLDFKTQSSD